MSKRRTDRVASWTRSLAFVPVVIVVHSESPSEIFLNGEAQGSVEESGLLALKVVPGIHEIVSERTGYRPEHRIVDARTATIAIHVELRPSQPARPMRLERAVNTGRGGALVLDALSDSVINLTSSQLGWRKIAFETQPWVVRDLEPGAHRITLCDEHKCLDYRPTILRGSIRSVVIDLEQGEIRDRSDAEQKARAAAEQACRANGSLDACLAACRFDRTLSLTRPSRSCKVAVRRASALPPTRGTPRGRTKARADDPSGLDASKQIEQRLP